MKRVAWANRQSSVIDHDGRAISVPAIGGTINAINGVATEQASEMDKR